MEIRTGSRKSATRQKAVKARSAKADFTSIPRGFCVIIGAASYCRNGFLRLSQPTVVSGP